MHEVLWWSLIVLLMLAGIVGTLLPILPGPVLIFAAIALHRVVFGAAGVGNWTLIGIAVMVLASYALDFLAGSAGARWAGASRMGVLGGVIGSVVGLFFFPLGLILGPLLGVLAGELYAGKNTGEASRASLGTVAGTLVGTLAKLGIALAMIAWFLIAIWVG